MDLYQGRRDFNSIRIAYRDKRNRLGEAIRLGSCVYRASSSTEQPGNSNGVPSLPLTDRSAGAAASPGQAARILQVQPAPRQLTPGREAKKQINLPRVAGISAGGAAAAPMNGTSRRVGEEADFASPNRALNRSVPQAEAAISSDPDLDPDRMPAPGEAEASYSCSIRLRKIAKLVASDGISKDALIKNLTYAAQVLESVYLDETRAPRDTGRNSAADLSPEGSLSVTRRESSGRGAAVTAVTERLCNEEDELPEVPSGEVPNEVRDWLASTFTRSQTSLKQHREKPKFRSVANAIRAGIMVERIYRRLSSSSNINVPQNVLVLLKAGLDDWCFNIFELNEASDNHALKFVGFELLHKYDLINKFKINTNVLENFLTKCEEGYSRFSNPYHNLVHGADVAQTCHFIMSSSKLVNWLTDLEIFATIFAAIIHDYEHTGTTNNFHVNTASELALLYNDKGVLENHHASAVFRLMKLDEFNIISGLSREEYKEFRALVIDMVLNTDMSLHFQQIKNMKQLLSMPEKAPDQEWLFFGNGSNESRPRRTVLTAFPCGIDKEKALALMLHCADISHPGKRFDLHQRWTMSLLEEFFRQGDREKALDLPCSPLCDRSTTMVAQSQVGFIDFIMEPSFGVLGDMLEKILMPLFEQQRQHGTRNPVDEGGAANAAKPLRKWQAEGAFVLHRPWNEHLKTNRALWKEKADIEEAERAAAVESTAADGEKSSDAAAEQSNQQPPTAPGSSRQLDTIREDKH
ncbi:hypothetical protein BOX15_Mlig027833g1 [Macrostomum lignano]|uniref:Phosphodiesterase n=1 Tax=Macrostomum lignano TaxID=282301 RepID=A0A267H3H4_9PLAT|nr:hypothetical protein BOX15_Mlig027833g1 [Macrostomum lignano]